MENVLVKDDRGTGPLSHYRGKSRSSRRPATHVGGLATVTRGHVHYQPPRADLVLKKEAQTRLPRRLDREKNGAGGIGIAQGPTTQGEGLAGEDK